MNSIVCFSFLILSCSGIAQDTYNYPTQKVGLIYVYTTDNFEDAEWHAIKAADSLQADYDYAYQYDAEEGLRDTVTCGCGYQHGYIARGRFDEGSYVSIELASYYELDASTGTKTYIVVVESYPSNYELWSEVLKNVSVVYPEAAYIETEVYTGCMH